MSDKQTVTIVAGNGSERDYTVNANGNVNGACYGFLASNGGNVGRDVKVDTPVSLDRNDTTGASYGTFKYGT